MSLAEAFADKPNPWAKTCDLTKLLEELPDEEAEAVRAAVYGHMPATVIAKRLHDHGHWVGADAIRRHRNGICCKERQ